MHNFVVHGFGENPVASASSDSLSDDDIFDLSGAFAPFVAIGGSPFITLTLLSGVGSFLNSGIIDPENVPTVGTLLMQLPIANMVAFIILLVITSLKFFLSLSGISKVFCDLTLSKLEDITGMVCTIGVSFLVISATTVYAAEVSTATVGSSGIGYILTTVISATGAALAYGIYTVIKTMVSAIDILVCLFSSIPGATAFFVISKYIVNGVYFLIIVLNPFTAAVIGIIIVIIACFVFRAAKRLELYYRRIYLIPLANRIFRSKYIIPLIPEKLPRGVAAEFTHIDMCIECFFMNRNSKLYKREQCYFIRSDESNYIFKKRLFRKAIKMELSGDAYIEKPFIFRFLKIFTDEAWHMSQRKVNLVVRREHGKNLDEIIEKAGLIDYNIILEERRQKKAEEMALKAQQMKEQAAQKLTSAGNKLKGTFGGILSRNKEKHCDLIETPGIQQDDTKDDNTLTGEETIN